MTTKWIVRGPSSAIALAALVLAGQGQADGPTDDRLRDQLAAAQREPASIHLNAVGIDILAPRWLEVLAVGPSSITWQSPNRFFAPPDTFAHELTFLRDAAPAGCAQWQARWQTQLQTAPSIDGLTWRLIPRMPYVDPRWHASVAAADHGLFGNWELCLDAPDGGRIVAKTSGEEINAALVLNAVASSVADAWYGKRNEPPVVMPMTQAHLRRSQHCEQTLQLAPSQRKLMQVSECMEMAYQDSRFRAECSFGEAMACGLLGAAATADGEFAAAASFYDRECELRGIRSCPDADDARKRATTAPPVAPATVTLPSPGVSFSVPPFVDILETAADGVRWRASKLHDATGAGAWLRFSVDPKMRTCRSWESGWKKRIRGQTAAPGLGVELLERPPYFDSRWHDFVVADHSHRAGDRVDPRTGWELCLDRRGGGVLISTTDAIPHDAALLLHGPTAEIATAWRGDSVASSLPEMPLPRSNPERTARCQAAQESASTDELLDRVADCDIVDRWTKNALACRYGEWTSCLGVAAAAKTYDNDAETAAVFEQRACDLTRAPQVCRSAEATRAAAHGSVPR